MVGKGRIRKFWPPLGNRGLCPCLSALSCLLLLTHVFGQSIAGKSIDDVREERVMVKSTDPKPAVPTTDQQAAEDEIAAALAKNKAENAAAAAVAAKPPDTKDKLQENKKERNRSDD